MDREAIIKEILDLPSRNLLLMLPTSFGKTRIALELLKQRVKTGGRVLVVIPRLMLINTWKEEIKKWGVENHEFTFSTYISFHKYSARHWDMVIFDECHHYTDKCIEVSRPKNYLNVVMLSATVKREKYWLLKGLYDFDVYKVSTREAIEENILPDPRVILVPLTLDDKEIRYTYIKNKKQRKTISCYYEQRMKYWFRRDVRVAVNCTAAQYVNILNDEIDWAKNKYFNTNKAYMKNIWLQLCGARLKFLSKIKEPVCKKLLERFKDKRTLTFCSSIQQTEELGKYCINSKNANSPEWLDAFNAGEINHITACNQLNEGVNLKACEVGLFSILSSSSVMVIQKIGRILRHRHPLIVIPFYKDTREEELVIKMCENFNKDKIEILEL